MKYIIALFAAFVILGYGSNLFSVKKCRDDYNDFIVRNSPKIPVVYPALSMSYWFPWVVEMTADIPNGKTVIKNGMGVYVMFFGHSVYSLREPDFAGP